MWFPFVVPCPTPDGLTAQDLYDKRVRWITDEMRVSAREHGCRFHRAWYAKDSSAFYAVADWETTELVRLGEDFGAQSHTLVADEDLAWPFAGAANHATPRAA